VLVNSCALGAYIFEAVRVVVSRVGRGVRDGAVLLHRDEGDPSVFGQNGPRATPMTLAAAVSLCIVSSRAAGPPAARGIVGEEDGGLLRFWVAVLIQLLPVVACLSSRRRAPAALLRSKRRLVAGVG
jgi:hypothetical protein